MPLKFSVFCMLIAISSLSYAGTWTRISPSSVSFSGEIEKDELKHFLEVYEPTDKTLILNSSGGNMDAALSIGSKLVENKNLTVIVQGICASSCANYLFLAGQKKQIDHGIVGFHGNWRAMVSSAKFKAQAQEVAPDVRSRILDYHKRKVQEETEFFKKLEVDQKLFDKTQKENDEGLYDIYIPGPRIFESYGIHGVKGTQDLRVLQKWPETRAQYDNGSTQTQPFPPVTGKQ